MPSSLIPKSNLFRFQFHIQRSLSKSLLSLPLASPLERNAGDLQDPTHSLIASIKSLSTKGFLSEAFATFSLLRRCTPSSSLLLQPISSLLFCSTALKAHQHGQHLHACVISIGLLHSPSLVTRLASFYVGLGLLSDASAVARYSICLDVLPWNILISTYVRKGLSTEALAAYKNMVEMGVDADSFTYTSVLSACGEILQLEMGVEVHRRIASSGIGWNLFVCNALVAMYAKCGELIIARSLFDGMPDRDVVSWNSMISGYASRGMWKEAFRLFEQMRAVGSDVNAVTWNTIIGSKLQIGDHLEALRLISQMRMSGSGLDFVTLVIGLNACSRIGSLRLGKEIHGLIIRICCDGLETVTNALVTMYSRCESIDRAYVLFQLAKIRSLVTWNAMIAGFALEDQAEEASKVFRDMVSSGIEANYVTLVTILSLCARITNLQHGRELHCYIIKHEFKGYRLLWNALVDMYSKSGRILIARRVFDMMSDHDEVSYTSMIAGYGIQGEGISALKLFDDMIKCGIKPDHISMVAVLSACSHSGLVSQGEILFDHMVDLYGVMPQMEHFSCMVDLLARAGLLQKAVEVLKRMPYPPTAAMWAALLGACQVHENTEIGEMAATRLLEMKTHNAGHYVLIANMYAAAGCWEELANVRTLMRNMGVRKAPGCAWADLGNGFHPFLVDDRSSSVSDEIYVLLDGLFDQMRDAGYICNEDLGLDEEH